MQVFKLCVLFLRDRQKDEMFMHTLNWFKLHILCACRKSGPSGTYNVRCCLFLYEHVFYLEGLGSGLMVWLQLLFKLKKKMVTRINIFNDIVRKGRMFL